MPLMTIGQVRDVVSRALKDTFPDLWPHQVLDYSALQRYRGRDFVDVELPVVTYSVQFRPHYERVVDYYKRIHVEEKWGEVEEGVPYRVELALACHSDVQAEAEELGHRVHRKLGHAPCLEGIPFYLNSAYYGGAVELGGVYSVLFVWEGWVRIPGRREEAPLITAAQYAATVSLLPFEPPEEPTPEAPQTPVEMTEKEVDC